MLFNYSHHFNFNLKLINLITVSLQLQNKHLQMQFTDFFFSQNILTNQTHMRHTHKSSCLWFRVSMVLNFSPHTVFRWLTMDATEDYFNDFLHTHKNFHTRAYDVVLD